jgi:hypothetical protein
VIIHRISTVRFLPGNSGVNLSREGVIDQRLMVSGQSWTEPPPEEVVREAIVKAGRPVYSNAPSAGPFALGASSWDERRR